ncbi:MAG: hypothetical protein VCD00_04525 [Candidatus Hydrogenedentota bacterium]
MVRLIPMLLGTLVLGLIIGNLLSGDTNTPTEVAITPISGAETGPDSYQEMIATKEAVIAQLTDKNVELNALVRRYAEEMQEQPEPPVENIPTEEIVSDESSEAVNEESDPQDERRNRWGDRSRWEDPEQREQMINSMREGMVDRWTEEWEKASPESQERITAISTYQQDLMDSRMAMRDAETDEDREILREEMRYTQEALRETISAEQNAQLTRIAESYGLKSDKERNAFVQETRKLLSSPIFQSGGRGPGGFTGGRRGGR